MSDEGITLRFQVDLDRSRRSHRLVSRNGAAARRSPLGKIPRVARLVALAHHLQGLIDRGEVLNQKELADVAEVSRARVTQIMNLLLLAPDIQEQILFLPRTVSGRDPISERMLRHVGSTPVWSEQRKRWGDIEAGLAEQFRVADEDSAGRVRADSHGPV